MKEPTLIVLAAGLGSRYGSLKQIDKFGPNGETIVDYTLYDAIDAGFKKIVFVIRKNIEKEFIEIFLNPLSSRVKIDYVFQELDNLPAGLSVPEKRVKPWGTAHAVWICRNKINSSFAIVNADDFYGRNSLNLMYKQLVTLDTKKLGACLIGYSLNKTLSEYGRVSRGICEVSSNGHLDKIVERTDIYKGKSVPAYYEEDGHKISLTGKETVSMNLMGFTPRVFELIEDGIVQFHKENFNNLKAEYYIPSVLDNVRKKGVLVPVINTDETWFGVTYKEDKTIVEKNIRELVEQKKYPYKLWN